MAYQSALFLRYSHPLPVLFSPPHAFCSNIPGLLGFPLTRHVRSHQSLCTYVSSPWTLFSKMCTYLPHLFQLSPSPWGYPCHSISNCVPTISGTPWPTSLLFLHRTSHHRTYSVFYLYILVIIWLPLLGYKGKNIVHCRIPRPVTNTRLAYDKYLLNKWMNESKSRLFCRSWK